jgi:hypothetical protein
MGAARGTLGCAGGGTAGHVIGGIVEDVIEMCMDDEAGNDPIYDEEEEQEQICLLECEYMYLDNLEYCLMNGGPNGPLDESQYQQCLVFAELRWQSCKADCLGK